MLHALRSCYHLLWSVFGAALYHRPSRQLVVVGVTGTNGKTTVVELVSHILRRAGVRVASVSSVRFVIDGSAQQNVTKMTMPGRAFMQRFLRRAVRAGATHAVLEITSEGVRQHRHRFIDFDVAALTNVTPEHIESHGGFERYREAKLEFFHALLRSHKSRTATVVNADDPSAALFFAVPAGERWAYGFSAGRSFGHEARVALLEPAAVRTEAQGISFVLEGVEFSASLLGEFNVSNMLCAVAICRQIGIPMETIRDAARSFVGVPGRLEYVREGQYFDVIVDYAHTPDALRRVYETLGGKNGKRLICVLGAAGGGRDKWKRPELGKIAQEYCSRVIVTNEDPYDEDPATIINEVAVNPAFEKILDRRTAIEKAISYAAPGDTVIITGKGAEPLMAVAGGKKIAWDDREVARLILRKLVGQ